MRRLSERDRDVLDRTRFVLLILFAGFGVMFVPLLALGGTWYMLFLMFLVIGYAVLLAAVPTVLQLFFGWGHIGSVLLTIGVALLIAGVAMVTVLQVPSALAIAFPFAAGTALLLLAFAWRGAP